MEGKVLRRAQHNVGRLRSCKVHDFDWVDALQRARERRKAREEQYGVVLGIREVVWCRCKHCGGRVLVEYAAAYMDGVKAMRTAIIEWGVQPP